jgi:uncharacterized lipoprotein YajG
MQNVALGIVRRARARKAPCRIAAAILCTAAAVVAGCGGQQPAALLITYTEQSYVQSAEGASGIAVKVTVDDARATRGQLGAVPGGVGIPDQPIVPDNDVREVLRSAIEHELEVRGFNLTPSARAGVHVTLTQFRAEFHRGLMFQTASATLTMNVQVIWPGRATPYSETISGAGQEGGIAEPSATSAGPALNRALDAAVRNLFDDDRFVSGVILAGGGH